MYGIEDKLLAISFSLLIFVNYKAARIMAGTFAAPAAIFSICWLSFTIIPLLLLFNAPINSLAILYILLANVAFFISATPFNWQKSIKKNACKKYSKVAFDSKFLSFVLYSSVAASLLLSFAVVLINGFSLEKIIFDLIATSGEYARVRGTEGLEYGLLGVLSILFTYLPPVLGGLRILDSKRGVFFGISMLPSLLTMIIQSQKLVFLIALCFYLSGAIVAKIYRNNLDFPTPKSIPRLFATTIILSSLVLISFISRLGEFQLETFETIMDPLLFSIASYTLGQIYAFADFFSYTIGSPSLTSFKNEYYSFGKFTFNSIFSSFGFGKDFPPGMYDESSWYSNVFQTNLFTFYRGLIYDFGIFGSLIFLLFFGLISNYIAYIVFSKPRAWFAVVALISIYVFIMMGYLFSVFVARYVFFTATVLWILLSVNDILYRSRKNP